MTFSWMAAPFRTLLYVMVFLIGALVGMEVPLVMRALNARQTELSMNWSAACSPSTTWARWPCRCCSRWCWRRIWAWCAPASCSACSTWAWACGRIYVFRAELKNLTGRLLRACAVMLVLVAGFAMSDRMVAWGEHGLFGDEIVYSTTTPYQRLVITRWKDDTRLYINGNLQFSSRDEYRYHEALVHPVLEALPWARRVLVLGGGDGLALREILRYPQHRARHRGRPRPGHDGRVHHAPGAGQAE